MVVTCEPVSNRQLHVFPAMLTTAEHLDPIKPFGSPVSNLCESGCDITAHLTVFGSFLGQVWPLLVPVCPTTGTSSSLNDCDWMWIVVSGQTVSFYELPEKSWAHSDIVDGYGHLHHT